MDRLQAQFHPDRFDLIQLPEQSDHIVIQTVRPGGNGEYLYIGIVDCFRKYGFQISDRCICVCKSLKIGDIRVTVV